ncbi:helix-turn-helix transcriptional regulator [Tumebacillus sp. ITR2]|uniref:Helix-turn-helix transcriptional regulator n=1 Tax=Tumebacillus amylolyticus TaxID=2801339 RepID=A0ABS1JDY5_9BACL|nr:helix-turn-helix transcriptional regulator [Tumebacillus amylolyticus]MBL0388454.1 helix-turn-helix transcriptional regulator [Tumebacillus amylolyticus]
MASQNALERLFKEQKLTVQKVSELTGVSSLALEYMVENNTQPKPHVAQKVAKVLNVSVDQIWPKTAK